MDFYNAIILITVPSSIISIVSKIYEKLVNGTIVDLFEKYELIGTSTIFLGFLTQCKFLAAVGNRIIRFLRGLFFSSTPGYSNGF